MRPCLEKEEQLNYNSMKGPVVQEQKGLEKEKG